MILEALQYMYDKGFASHETEVVKIAGLPYIKNSHGEVNRVKPPSANAISVTTLGAIVKFCEKNRDDLEASKVLVNVTGPGFVDVIGTLRDGRDREDYLTASLATKGQWGDFLEREIATDKLITLIQTHFEDEGDRAELLALVGNLTSEAVRVDESDGMTQNVEVKVGVHTREKKDVKNPIMLTPKRSFPEVRLEPVPFVVRIKIGEPTEPPRIGLYESDGGAWKLDAINKIGAFLDDALPDTIAVIY